MNRVPGVARYPEVEDVPLSIECLEALRGDSAAVRASRVVLHALAHVGALLGGWRPHAETIEEDTFRRITRRIEREARAEMFARGQQVRQRGPFG